MVKMLSDFADLYMMKIEKPWIKALGVSEDQIRSWSKNVPEGQSLTHWCLKNKAISPQSYFTWARNYYQLPTVNSKFFLKHFDQNLWFKIREVANWSEELLPMSEWDGVVFVATAEPLESARWSFPVQFILCDPQVLSSQWQQIQTLQKTSFEISDEPTMTEYKEVSTSEPEIMPDEPVIHLGANESSPSTPSEPVIHLGANESSPPPPIGASEAPAVINLGPTEADSSIKIESISDSSDLDANSPNPPESEDISELSLEASPPQAPINLAVPVNDVASENFQVEVMEADVEFQMPEGIANTAKTLVNAEVPEGLNFDIGHDSETDVESPQSEFVAPEGLETQLPSKEESITPKESLAPTNLSVELANNSQPSETKSFDEITATLSPEEIEKISLALTLDNPEISAVFEEFHKHYHSVMVLLLEGESLKPWFHDGTWNPRDRSANEAFDISSPSIFRIVKKSLMPFHGPISSNEVNDSFFRSWGYVENPSLVSLIPINYDSHIVGMVLCIGNQETSSLQALAFAENCAKKIKPLIENLNRAA